MRIGIDISQIVYEGTGVAEYTIRLINSLLKYDDKNEFVLFFCNRRYKITNYELRITSKTTIKQFPVPIQIFEFLWNRLHIFPIEWFIGNVDVFFSSDWLEPPTKKAKKVTTIHDLSVFKYPETLDRKIVAVHRRKLNWVKNECDMIICDSESTKKDCIELLQIQEERLKVIYPGIV